MNFGRARAGLALTVALAAIAFSGGTSLAHTPSASMACEGEQDPQPILRVNLTQYNGTNHVTIKVDGDTVVDEDFGNSWSTTLDAGSPTKAHVAQVVILAHDDPTGSKGWSKTYDLEAPACQEPPPPPPPAKYRPAAWAKGPYCDPMYVYVLDNRKSDRPVTFKMVRTSHGIRRVQERTVGAGILVRTQMKHVDGRTWSTIKARGDVLYRFQAAKGGQYPAPKGQSCPK